MTRKIALLLVLLLALAACGDDTDTDTDTEPDNGEAAGEMLTVIANDYAFAGVPDTVAVGTEITLNNQGSEPHEAVAFHIPDDEERSLQELLALPEDEEPDLNFKGVVIQLSDGSPAMTPEGPVVLDEPGKYALVCFFPVGLTDADLQEAMAQMEEGSEGPPPLPEGPPHFTEGMFVEFTVE